MGVQRLGERAALGIRHVLGSKTCRECFERLAHIIELGDGIDIRRNHPRADIRLIGDEAGGREPPNSFTYRTPAYSQALRYFQLIYTAAGAKSAIFNVFTYKKHDAISQKTAGARAAVRINVGVYNLYVRISNFHQISI